MKKTEQGWWLVICLWPLMAVSAFPSGALAATCEAGDVSKGYWKRAANPEGCIIPGAPAADSPWPTSFSSNLLSKYGYPYRIEGKYKLTVVIGVEGFSGTIPPTRSECITGLAEAYTAASRINYQRGCPESGCGRCDFIAQGTLLTMHSWDCNGYNHYQYARFFEVPFMLEEWVWTNKDCANEPPPSPTNTPNPDPGRPDCNNNGL